MKTFSFGNAQSNLDAILDEVIHLGQPVMIDRDGLAQVVLMPARTLLSYAETDYLLSSPANARKLMFSLEQANPGQLHGVTIERLRGMAS